jgi:hypothetical protein
VTLLLVLVAWFMAGALATLVLGPRLRRAAELAGVALEPEPIFLANRSPLRWRVGTLVVVGLLAGSTGMAAAGALPGSAQTLAHHVLGTVGVHVPEAPPAPPTVAAPVATPWGEVGTGAVASDAVAMPGLRTGESGPALGGATGTADPATVGDSHASGGAPSAAAHGANATAGTPTEVRPEPSDVAGDAVDPPGSEPSDVPADPAAEEPPPTTTTTTPPAETPPTDPAADQPPQASGDPTTTTSLPPGPETPPQDSATTASSSSP